METLGRLAARLDDAAAFLGDAAGQLPDLAVWGPALGADAPGLPGELGRALRARLIAALEARAREAADVAGQLTEVADAVRLTAANYADADEAADRRHGDQAAHHRRPGDR